MPANVENSAVATGLERSFSLQSPRKVISKNVQLPHSCTHLTCYQSNFSKQVCNNTRTVNFHMCKLDLEKAEKPKIKLPTSVGSQKKQKNSRNIPTSALLTMQKPLTLWITTNCGKLSSDHRTGKVIFLAISKKGDLKECSATTQLHSSHMLPK